MWQSLSPMLHEFHRESATTRRVLDRVPADKLAWAPHTKSMTIGKLAGHIASVPGGITRIAQNDVHEIDPTAFAPQQPKNKQDHAQFAIAKGCRSDCLYRVIDVCNVLNADDRLIGCADNQRSIIPGLRYLVICSDIRGDLIVAELSLRTV